MTTTTANYILQPQYLPKLQKKNTQCIWKLPPEFNENKGMSSLGFFQSCLLDKRLNNCRIDFQHVEWADPLPLLCLGLILAESKLAKSKIIINLGGRDKKRATTLQRIFLKFLAKQGFLLQLSNHATFRYENKIQNNVENLRINLSSDSQPMHFQNAECILARLLRVDKLREKELTRIVESLIRESQDRSMANAFGANPVARDMLFQKLRKLLYELLLNVNEHSHPTGAPAFAGVYARIRGPKPPIEDDAVAWTKLFSKTSNTFGQKQFSPNPYTEWLELFICDIGVGLTSNIAEWENTDDPEVAKDIRLAKKSQNPLESIAHRLFRSTLSRHPRHDTNRTAVTGLQHLGHLLTIGSDYCRIYTQRGSWIGDHLPWGTSYSRKDIRHLLRKPEHQSIESLSGTAYSFCIQPNHHNVSFKQSVWAHPNKDALKQLKRIFSTLTEFVTDDTEYYDRCDQSNCLPPLLEELDSKIPQTIVLRPPRLTSKKDISKWLELVAGSNDKPLRPIKSLVLADLSPFQTLTFRELLLNISVHLETKLDIYLVSEQWAVVCVTTTPGDKKFIPSTEKSNQFLSDDNSELVFSITKLALLLRQLDSEIFWEVEPDPVQDPFFNAPVNWHTSENKKETIKLKRFLDFPRALANPDRYRACSRSLRRCLALYPDHKAVGADDLVASLVRDAMLKSYSRRDDTKLPIIVGSIAVTAGTVNRLRYDHEACPIQMLVHGDVQHLSGASGSLVAMLWMPKPQVHKSQENEKNIRPWHRIPNTPYISPHGEQSVSILRYKRQKNGYLDFNQPLYGRTPEETYKDFQRLEILKTGHWKYGNRHDLLTINMRFAFRFSFLELGPLYYWMQNQFKLLFTKQEAGYNEPAKFLIYPSHPVIDTLLDRIRQDPGFKKILPEGGMIPVKFLGIKTVSPLLASHLVAYRIEQLVNDRKWDSWAAAILDDGTVSGKHFRELVQFLQSLNAEKVYTLAFLDRTGLPAQEKVFDNFFDRHRRFWRWDVPELGNERDCPLCRGLSIVQTLAHRLRSERQNKRLMKWLELWRVRDVETEWHSGGIKPVPLLPSLKITFGVDQRDNGKRVEKHLYLNDSTSATSLGLELTRLTTRADVIVKKAKTLKKRCPDAAIEMIASQLLLFLDELSVREKLERFTLLLKMIWKRPATTQIMSLTGICFALADHSVIKDLWQICLNDLLPTKQLGNLDAILATNIIRFRYHYLTKEKYSLSEKPREIERHNYIMLGGGEDFQQDIRSFLVTLYRNPSNPDRVGSHTTAIRQRLVDFNTSCKSDKITDVTKYARLIQQDMRLVEQIINKLKSELISDIPFSKIQLFMDLNNQFEEELANTKIQNDSNISISNLQLIGEKIANILYVGSESLITMLGDYFFIHSQDSDEFDNNLVAKLMRSVIRTWPTLIKTKAKLAKNDIAIKRWQPKSDKLILPDICCSSTSNAHDIWIYCDTFVKQTIKDTLANVFHASQPISDPWLTDAPTTTDNDAVLAHMWWRIEIVNCYAVLTAANASGNRQINIKHTVNVAGLERVGGRINTAIEKKNSIVFISLFLPLHSAFIKEN